MTSRRDPAADLTGCRVAARHEEGRGALHATLVAAVAALGSSAGESPPEG